MPEARRKLLTWNELHAKSVLEMQQQRAAYECGYCQERIGRPTQAVLASFTPNFHVDCDVRPVCVRCGRVNRADIALRAAEYEWWRRTGRPYPGVIA